MTLTGWLRFVRIANACTTLADVSAGWVLATSLHAHEPNLLNLAMALIACMLIYGLGIITNDLGDIDEDVRHHPERALPSGQTLPRTAWCVAAGFCVIAGGLLIATGTTAAWVALLLTALIVLYNFILPDGSWASSLSMGACRGAAVVLGFAAAAGPLNELANLTVAVPILGYVLLVTFVTRVSLAEESHSEPEPRLFYRVAIPACYLLPVALSSDVIAVGIALMWALGFLASPPAGPSGYVRRVIFTTPIYGALIAAGVGAWLWAFPIAALQFVVAGVRRVVAQSDS